MLSIFTFLALFFGAVIALSVVAFLLIDGAEYKRYREDEKARGKPYNWFLYCLAYRFEPDRRVRHDPYSFGHFLVRAGITLVPIALVLHFFF